MAFYHDPGEADHARPVVTIRIEPSRHPTQHGTRNETRQGRHQRRLELFPHAIPDEARGALHRLQSDIAGETVGDYNVHFAREDVIAFHESNVVETRGLQERMGRLHDLVSLDVLFANIEQADPGLLQPVDVTGDDGAHRRKLTQLLRCRLGVRTEIEHLCVPVRGGNRGNDGGALDSFDGLQDEVCHRGERTGVAGADTSARFALFYQVDGNAHRRVLLASDRLA